MLSIYIFEHSTDLESLDSLRLLRLSSLMHYMCCFIYLTNEEHVVYFFIFTVDMTGMALIIAFIKILNVVFDALMPVFKRYFGRNCYCSFKISNRHLYFTVLLKDPAFKH